MLHAWHEDDCHDQWLYDLHAVQVALICCVSGVMTIMAWSQAARWDLCTFDAYKGTYRDCFMVVDRLAPLSQLLQCMWVLVHNQINPHIRIKGYRHTNLLD
jgi:hypothetical protein